MKSAIKSAKDHNFEYIILGTVEKLKAAQKFYLKHGFSNIEKEQLPENFEPCPVDTVFFRKKI